MAKLICNHCGAIVQISTSRNTVCPYCGSGYLTMTAPSGGRMENGGKNTPSKKKSRSSLIVALVLLEVAILALLMLLVVIPEVRYNRAAELIEQGDYSDAIPVLEKLGGYRNSVYLLEYCTTIEEMKEHRSYSTGGSYVIAFPLYGIEKTLFAGEESENQIQTTLICFAAGGGAIVVAVVLFILVALPRLKYLKALELTQQGRYIEAIAAFESTNGYRDSEEKIENLSRLLSESEI